MNPATQASSSTHRPGKGIRLLLLGASGAVGSKVLELALRDARIAQVLAPTRQALPAAGNSERLINPVTDFSRPDPQDPWWQCDAVICALGTTLRKAGSQEAFAAIDRDLPIRCGQLAKAGGARHFALNSSLGASLRGNFYLRTKAQAEEGLKALQFESLTIVRPSLIDAQRTESRPGEAFGLLLARGLRPLIPGRYRAVSTESIARALIAGALEAGPGVQVIESEALHSVPEVSP